MRKDPEPYLINFVDSGSVNDMAYGAWIWSVQMTRGNRQGNNAFLSQASQHRDYKNINTLVYDEFFLTKLALHKKISDEVANALLNSNLGEAMRNQ